MNSFQVIETLGVAIIIVIQGVIFLRTLVKIRRFSSTFDATSAIFLADIPVADLNARKPTDIINDFAAYEKKSETGFTSWQQNLTGDDMHALQPVAKKEIHLIIPAANRSHILAEIITSINIYLIKNRGASSDFHLIKDMVERNADTQEEEISHTISLPLYLGLLGTMFGIVFGLFNITDLGKDLAADNHADEGITILLSGVKIAMIASLTGLGFTVINSGWFYKKAKFKRETKKNDFYTFIQTELLPVLNQNINATLYSLQNNLFRFNEEFSGNIVRLNGIMNNNYDALAAQERIISTIERMDVTAFVKANITILQELQGATGKFALFNAYLADVNDMVANSGKFITHINELLARTENLGALASKIVEAFEFNRRLQEFLQHHYSALENSQHVFQEKLTGVNDVLHQTLDQLKEFVQNKIIEVKQISLLEIEAIREQYPEKWKKLDNLIHLEQLNSNVAAIKSGSITQSGQLKEELTSLNEKFTEVLNEFEEIKKQRANTIYRRVLTRLQRMFIKKQNPDEE